MRHARFQARGEGGNTRGHGTAVTIMHPEARDCPTRPALWMAGADTFGYFFLELLHNIGAMELFPPDLNGYLARA